MSVSDTLIQIRLNGEDREIPAGLDVRALLLELGLKPEMIVVEHNREILSRESYPDVAVSSGDTLELVHFVGGG